MQVLERVELSISGILNDRPFRADGSVQVNAAQGLKIGTITFDPPPLWMGRGPDPTPLVTTRCFVGARWVGSTPLQGPLDLLGSEFSSLRVTTEGRYGSISAGETARLVGRTLHSEIVEVGKLKRPPVTAIGPLREVLTVGSRGTLVARGSYSLLTRNGRVIPARYHHFYQSLKPNARLFRQYRNKKYLLRATFKLGPLSRKMKYETRSAIRLVGPDR